MASWKTVTPQTIIGEQGVALISTRCLEMGFIFHPRGSTTVSTATSIWSSPAAARFNQTLLVQSKAQNRLFPGDGGRLPLPLRRAGSRPWLSGNAPVILIFSHPEQGEAWWVDVKAAFPDVVTRASRTVIVDKHAQRFDKDAAPALLRWPSRPTRACTCGRLGTWSALRDYLQLPIATMPPVVYLATSTVLFTRRLARPWPRSPSAALADLLRDGKIMSFARPAGAATEYPLRRGCRR